MGENHINLWENESCKGRLVGVKLIRNRSQNSERSSSKQWHESKIGTEGNCYKALKIPFSCSTLPSSSTQSISTAKTIQEMDESLRALIVGNT